VVLDTVFGKLGRVKLCWVTEAIWKISLFMSDISAWSALTAFWLSSKKQ